jgi:nicotinate phosphoribosyltransferase
MMTDLYQITMAYGYWKTEQAAREAAFHLHFRKNPFQGGFAVACGLADAIAYAENLRFEASGLEYLRGLVGSDGQPLFDSGFIATLRDLRFSCDVDAVPEGTVIFPNEPLLRVTGPLLQGQLMETALLNFLNFQTLIATKAARVCLAAGSDPVVEFGLRRAQGPNGALSASRAAYIGGCAATSNVQAGQHFGIPVKGTHAHSWVMSFDDEREAFLAYARAMPNNCILLVDTYDTLDGVRHAIEVGKWLREQGHQLAGIRLDSGDLAWLSIEARKILDAAGFPEVRIVASNDLDESIIQSLKEQGAKIDIWGVGTKLVTAYDQPALGGVYKMGAIRSPDGRWVHKLKLSEQAAKISTPGLHQVRRFRLGDEFVGDGIYDLETGAPENFTIVDPLDATRRKQPARNATHEDLLVPIFRQGRLVYKSPPLESIRSRVQSQLHMFHGGVKRFVNPHEYPVGLELGLHKLKTRLILQARGEASAA